MPSPDRLQDFAPIDRRRSARGATVGAALTLNTVVLHADLPYWDHYLYQLHKNDGTTTDRRLDRARDFGASFACQPRQPHSTIYV